MATRRHFIQAMAALPAAATLELLAQEAKPDPARFALVVGNDAYRDAPLVNARNDAGAMAGLLAQAGFTVESLLDGGRERMLETIGRFGDAVRKPEVKEVAFFYAGHGVQLDWQNFLVPVDAQVGDAKQVAARCLDLGLILRRLSETKGKTFVIVLDACRNDPFGGGYRPEQKGLSQFDAPPGSLLAYSTAPGSVASDGGGRNSLYTENLVRELSVRTVRFEDALKRVRLNVRLASRGRQVPWETTSLEGDLYLFRNGQRKLSEEELEAEVEADIALWHTVKSSRNADDWIGYLKRFPNGRFAEMAQMRLTRLMVSPEAAGSASVAAAATATKEPPRISTEAEWNALASGSLYFDPRGNLRRKS
jgi:hypothetical protein